MDEQGAKLPSHFIFIAMLVAVLVISVPNYLIVMALADGRLEGDELTAFVSLLIAGVLMFVPAGLVLALQRLRDPALPAGEWVVTGMLAGLIGAIMLNLMVLTMHLTGGALPDLPVTIIGIFAIAAVEGAILGVISRAFALRFFGWR